MREQGHLYTPELQSLDQAPESAHESARVNGYGIVDTFLMQVGPPDERTDNDVYVSTLTPAELDAYHQSLWGANYPESVGGCRGQAEAAVLTEAEHLYFEHLPEMLDDVQHRVSASEVYREFEAEWASCMKSRGHTFSTNGEAKAHVQAEVHELATSNPFRASANGLTDAELEEAGFVQLAKPEAVERLEQIHEDERSIALADFECSDEHGQDVVDLALAMEAEYANSLESTDHDHDHDH